MASLASHIRAARAYAGLTQGELADALGVEVQWVKRREASIQTPREAELVAIADKCSVPLEFLHHGFSDDLIGPEAQNQLDRIEGKLDRLLSPDARREALKFMAAFAARQAPAAATPPATAPSQNGPRKQAAS